MVILDGASDMRPTCRCLRLGGRGAGPHADLLPISALTRLTLLDLGGTQLGHHLPTLPVVLAALVGLRELDVSDGGIRSAAQLLASVPSGLTSLRAGNNPLDRGSVAVLGRLTRLQHLEIGVAAAAAAAVPTVDAAVLMVDDHARELSMASAFSNIRSLSLLTCLCLSASDGLHPGQALLEGVLDASADAALGGLRRLSLRGISPSPQAVARVAAACTQLDILEVLTVEQGPQDIASAPRDVVSCPSSSPQAPRVALAALVPLPLRRLQLQGCGLSDDDVMCLQGMAQLRELDLRANRQVSEDCHRQLFECMPWLDAYGEACDGEEWGVVDSSVDYWYAWNGMETDFSLPYDPHPWPKWRAPQPWRRDWAGKALGG